MRAPIRSDRILVIDDNAILHAGLAAVFGGGNGAATRTTSIAPREITWRQLTPERASTYDLVVIRALLEDHVPAPLKVRALTELGVRSAAILPHAAPPHADRLRLEGAAFVLSSNDAFGDLVPAVWSALAAGHPVRDASPSREVLTDREMQVACLFASRAAPSSARLAAMLGLDTETVRSHLRRARLKYRARSMAVGTREELRGHLVDDGWLLAEI